MMNTTEIIKRLRYKAENIRAKLEPSYFSECADYLDKYRWHDLRKNPSDLPNCEREVLAINENNEHMTFVTMGRVVIDGNLYDARDFDFDLDKFLFTECVVDGSVMRLKRNRIIAWKEIEPFEVNE